uniref:Uncharacterized protein n=1 Tax=Hyaloperonospora arabidopsidis (strain Emoy2) TaxID=559515 RepID=M4BJ12_HYAAE
MGLPSAAEAANEGAARGCARALATLGVSGCLSASAGDKTPAARIRAAALDAPFLARRIDELVMR